MIRKIRNSVLLLCMWCCSANGAVIFVDHAAAGAATGHNWNDAFVSISAALASASTGDSVWVASGTYGPIVLKEGVRILGGFSGNEVDAAHAQPLVHKTFISGGNAKQAVIGKNISSSTVVRGVHIVDGVATGWTETGGGLYLEHGSAMFVDCVFRNNWAFWAGGAVALNKKSAPTFVNCRFHSNGTKDAKVTIAGGAVFINDGSTTFTNCLFYKNRATEGGALVNITGDLTLSNCTLTENEATRGKGGALFDDSVHAKIRNSILWNNIAQKTSTSEMHNNRALGRTDTKFSLVADGWPGDGNINADPLFVNSATGDYRLQAGSPCRDRGNNAALPTDTADLSGNGNRTETLPRDLALRSRVEGNTVDMGAFEYVP